MKSSKSGGNEKGPIKREYSAGGVVYKKSKTGSRGWEILWLLIQPKVTREEPWRQGRWQLPKGWIDEGETSRQAALRETREEGGVEAVLGEKVDRITIFFTNNRKEKVLKDIVFYLMEWQRNLPDGFGDETQKILWLPFKEAEEKLTFRSERNVLRKAREVLGRSEKQPRLI